MKKVISVLVIIFSFTLLLGGCGATTDVKTGSPEYDATKEEVTKQQEGEPQKEDGRKVAVNQKFNSLGLEIVIGEIKVQKDAVLIGTTIKNTTQKKLTFYPDQGNVVIGNMQLDANMFLTEGDLSGDIQGGVEKSGVIAFTVPEGKSLDPESVTQLALNWGDIYNEAYDTKEFNATIALK